MTPEQLNVAFALTTICVITRHWLRERRARLGDRCEQVLGDRAHELLTRVEQRQDARIRAGMAQLTDDEIARILNSESVMEPIRPRDFVVVERGRALRFEDDHGPRAA